MQNFEYWTPTKVTFGKGVENKVGEEVKFFGGTKVLIHYGGGSVVRSGLLDRVKKSLEEAGIGYVELGGVVPNPRMSLAYKGIELCKKEGVDFVLGIGGGSANDSAKCIALGVPYDGDVWDFYCGKAVPQKALPTGNIITLAATGSEMSNSSVMTNEDGWLKRSWNGDLNRPRFALMNPELTYTLPPYQTSCGIADIMMHTFERFFSPADGVSEITDRIAVQVLRTMIQYGPRCLENPEDYDARSEVMWTGSLSHNWLTGLGRKGDWACHQLEHEIGGMFDVAHGAGLAAVWGAWARYVYKENPMRFARFGVEVWGLNLNYDDVEETALAAIAKTVEFFRSINMPTNTTDLLGGKEMTEEQMRELAVKCTFFGKRKIGGFKKLGEEDIYQIYANSRYEGK